MPLVSALTMQTISSLSIQPHPGQVAQGRVSAEVECGGLLH
jgi:hypothetical protein